MEQTNEFDLTELNSIKTFNDRMEYCVSKLGAPIGIGSSRLVFSFNDDTVLKLAYNHGGIKQNQREYETAKLRKNLFAQVYNYNTQYLWIVSEKAIESTKEDFENITGYNFDFFKAFVTYTYSIYGTITQFHKLREKKFDTQIEKLINSKDFDNTIFHDIYYYMLDFKMETPGELTRTSSWGVTNKNGKEKLIFIDYGFQNNEGAEFFKQIPRFLNFLVFIKKIKDFFLKILPF